MAFENINLLAVLLAAVAYFAIGMIWYSPSLFGKQWMKLVGIKKKDKRSMGGLMLLTFGTHLVLVYIFAWFLELFGVTTANGGAIMAFYVWIGFFATTQLGSFIWEQKSIRLYIINTLYMLVSLLVVGLIIGAL